MITLSCFTVSCEDVPTKKEDLVKKEQLIHATKVAKQFSFEELRVASNGFSEVLGRGGFGTVYKGRLDGSNVAIKMLSNTSQQGPQEFLNEVCPCSLFYCSAISFLIVLSSAHYQTVDVRPCY